MVEATAAHLTEVQCGAEEEVKSRITTRKKGPHSRDPKVPTYEQFVKEANSLGVHVVADRIRESVHKIQEFQRSADGRAHRQVVYHQRRLTAYANTLKRRRPSDIVFEWLIEQHVTFDERK